MSINIFVASSSESIDFARAVQNNFTEKKYIVQVWDQEVIKASDYPLDCLINEASNNDIGIFITSPDDYIKSREKLYYVVRDNVIFELGLFIGKLGKKRNFILYPQFDNEIQFSLPSDLIGLTYEKYYYYYPKSKITSSVANACNNIKHQINESHILSHNPIQRAGLFESINIDYKALFKKATNVTLGFIHSKMWRERLLDSIENFVQKEGTLLSIYLPNIKNTFLVDEMIKHFDDGTNMRDKIKDGYLYFSGLMEHYKSKIRISLFDLYPTYTFYKFDDEIVISMYPHAKKRKPTPTFLINSNNELIDFFNRDISDLSKDHIIDCNYEDLVNLLRDKKLWESE